MKLLILLATLGCMQVIKGANPLHKDAWFFRWGQWLSDRLPKHFGGLEASVIQIAVPVILVGVLDWYLPMFFSFVLAFIVLLYALGRGEFAPFMADYTSACNNAEWSKASSTANQSGIALEGVESGNWPELNQRVLQSAAYQGFERLFAVLFWFVFFGPVGALLYRLSFLLSQEQRNAVVQKWLWSLEWPAVRLLSVSFAVTGNFVGCINRCKAYLICMSSSSSVVLREAVLGALSVDDELVQSCDCTQREINALKRLYTRTLWFWVFSVAVFTILY